MLKRTDLKNVIEEIVKEELDKLINEGRYKNNSRRFKKALSEAPEIVEGEVVEFEMGIRRDFVRKTVSLLSLKKERKNYLCI